MGIHLLCTTHIPFCCFYSIKVDILELFTIILNPNDPLKALWHIFGISFFLQMCMFISTYKALYNLGFSSPLTKWMTLTFSLFTTVFWKIIFLPTTVFLCITYKTDSFYDANEILKVAYFRYSFNNFWNIIIQWTYLRTTDIVSFTFVCSLVCRFWSLCPLKFPDAFIWAGRKGTLIPIS